MVTTNIEIDGTPFTFYDVSAQENSRKKWLHQFKNVEVFLFVASLGDFNVISSQDPTRIKLDLALEMFKDGKDYEHIFKVTKVTEEEIDQQKKYNEKKTGDDTKKLQMIKKELERLLACL